MNNWFDNSVWASILVIIFGVLSGWFDNTLTTWFLFTFLCIVGVLRASLNMRKPK